jgi:hypothetical protein
MKGIRVFGLGTIFLFTTSFLAAQSVVEAAKKEKERREALKGKTVVAVTNADLAKTQKKPAVVTAPPPAVEDVQEGVPPPEALPKEGAAAVASEKPSANLQSEARKKYEEKRAELETKWKAAKELAELLDLKMNALWQQYYSFNTMVQKDQVQRTISETFQKYQTAKADEAKAKDELDRFTASGGKDFIPPVIK